MFFIENQIFSSIILPPIVQNCPNRLSDATLKPFESVVMRVSRGPTVGLAYSTSGKSFNGWDNGGYGVTIWFDNDVLLQNCRWLPFTAYLQKLSFLFGFNNDNLKRFQSEKQPHDPMANVLFFVFFYTILSDIAKVSLLFLSG